MEELSRGGTSGPISLTEEGFSVSSVGEDEWMCKGFLPRVVATASFGTGLLWLSDDFPDFLGIGANDSAKKSGKLVPKKIRDRNTIEVDRLIVSW